MTVEARPASTVVLIDDDARVYLTKRPSTMKFFADHYVFPGGAVDESDYDFELPADFKEKREVTTDFVHYIAAARELFEEVGILMTQEALTLTKREQVIYRKRLVKGEISLFKMIKKEKLSLDFDSLIEFAHFTTPRGYPIRYCTRFFIAKLPPNQMPLPDEYEVADAIWLTPEQSLIASKNGELLLPDPTIQVLKMVMQYQQNKNDNPLFGLP